MMGKTLEKMQAAGMLDEEEELTTPPAEEGELEVELEVADPAVVADDDDHDDIVLASDEQDHSRVEVPKKTLSKLRRTRREARDQVTERDAEIATLRAQVEQLSQVQQATLKKPQYADFRDDESYEAALLQYHSLVQKPNGAQQRRQAPPAQRQAPAPGPDFSDAVNEHLDRAEKLGVNLDKFATADAATRQTLGDQVTDALIAAVGPGSEKAMYLVGSDPKQMARVQQMLAADPSGLRVVAHLGRLAEKATVSKKSVSGAPRVSRTPQGGQSAANGGDAAGYQKKIAAAEKSGNVQKMVELRRQARKAGVTL